MKQYRYDIETKEYLGEFDCQPSPLEDGVFLVSANCTLEKPLKATANKVNVWEDGAWVLKDDYRGQDVQVLGSTVTIEEIGVTPESLEPTAEEQAEYDKQVRIGEIKQRLARIDFETIRPLRAGETDRVAELEAEAETLRTELQGLLA